MLRFFDYESDIDRIIGNGYRHPPVGYFSEWQRKNGRLISLRAAGVRPCHSRRQSNTTIDFGIEVINIGVIEVGRIL